jgi:hypothetical protein
MSSGVTARKPKAIALPVPTEHVEQVKVVTWFRLQYPAIKELLIAIPNGAHLAGTPIQRAKKIQRMKAEGFTTGVADLFLMKPSFGYSGLWIEMKRLKYSPSDVSDDQKAFQVRALDNGYQAVVCGGFEAAREAIKAYLQGVV